MEIDKPVTSVIVIIITLILVFLFVMPKYQEFLDLRQKLGEKVAEYQADIEYYAKINEIYNTLQANKDLVAKIDSALPPEQQLAPLLYFFQEKGLANAMTVENLNLVRVSKPTTDKGVRDIVFSLAIYGNYEGLKNFLDSIENSSRIFEVNTLSFSAPSSQPTSSATPTPAPRILRKAGLTATPQPTPAPMYHFVLEIKTHTY
jgi:Tfp pilus assembly protein PilO